MNRARFKQHLGLGLTALLGLTVTACYDGSDDDSGDCVSDEEFFRETVYAPILATNCASCHNSSGAAKETSFVLRSPESGPDYLESNLEAFSQMSKLQFEGQSWLLLKPTLGIEHEGGERFKEGSAEYGAFVEMMNRLETPSSCEEGDVTEEFFDGVELLDERATLRKATLALAGRLPTIEEDMRVQEGSWEALDSILDEVMTDPVFYDRLREIYNDKFLTDRYYGGTQALDLLDYEEDDNGNPGGDFPNTYWFDGLPDGEREQAAEYSNNGVARQPLELLVHIVKNNLPYTELLTADYTMVNPFSAQSLGVDATFADPDNYNEYVPARIPGLPHAGALTSAVFLNRFPTTDTNRNRHRSRMLYEFFLATDVQALGNRPVDATAITGHNATLNNPECTICHEVIDPVAGSFKNWDDQGRYRPPEQGWFPDMLPPGFGESQMPSDNDQAALQWGVREIVQDPRFALSAVYIMFEGLSGQKPLTEPDNPDDANYLGGIEAAKTQRAVFNDIAQQFTDANYELKLVVKEIIKSPYYRAYNYEAIGLDEDAAQARRFELENVGMGRLLTPEQLHRKIRAVTGFEWSTNPVDGTDYLLSEDQYMTLYGGLNSDDIISRVTEPNGIMANVAKRMANQMSCDATPWDFSKPASERILFPLVETTMQPEDLNGFEIPSASSAIRNNIQFLVSRLWGEYLDAGDPEIERIYQLFLDVWRDGQLGLQREDDDPERYGTGLGNCTLGTNPATGEELPEDQRLGEDPGYTIRAWMAVTNYMLSDFRFLHE
ncbi:MAG: DUF1588 domain-containing protein [Nannocystaceae bacterium]|nr:DUF1588 domain-containing protein [Nannocystaceae bacterium]